LRRSTLKSGKLLVFLVISICLAISACYELIEWAAAMFTGSAADAFLGTQGDVWDTQWDMFLALCGSVSALLTLSGVQDKQLNKMVIKSNL
jgi:putative membrane protein